MKQVLIHKDADDVQTTLDTLGLTIGELHEAAKANFLAQASCTANDAPTASGFIGWNASVRVLREALLIKGWDRKDIKNSPRVINPDGNVSIMFATGDEATGLSHAIPRTKSHKGATTRSAVYSNESQRMLFSDDALPHVIPIAAVGHSNKSTWVFLVHSHIDESLENPRHFVRCELSLPVGMDDAGHISAWSERIILPEITIDPDDFTTIDEDFAPEQEIILKRKA